MESIPIKDTEKINEEHSTITTQFFIDEINIYEEEDFEEEEESGVLKHVPCEYCPICGCPTCYCPFFGDHIQPQEGQNTNQGQINHNVENQAENQFKIEITTKSRTRKKTISTIRNLDKFGIDINDFASKVSKKLGTSCIFKTTQNGPEVIVSGDLILDIVFLLTNEHGVNKNDIICNKLLRKNAISKNQSNISRFEAHQQIISMKAEKVAKEKAKLKIKQPEIKGPRPKPGTKKAQKLSKKFK